MNWIGLLVGLASIGVGIAFIGPHRRGVRHRAMPNPLFNVIFYIGAGTIFVLWAIIEWAVTL